MSRSSASPRRTLRRRATAFIWFAALTASPWAPTSAVAAPMTARPAAAFRDSVGIQTHFPFPGFAYDRASTAQIAEMLRTIGVTHLRDDTCFLDAEADCARVRARIAELQGAFGPGGPKVDLLALYARELSTAPLRAVRDADIDRALTAAATPPLAGMIAGLEPVNEPDLKETRSWEAETLADDDTYRRLLTQPRLASLRSIPHLSPAIGHAKNTPLLLGAGWTADRATVPNFHPYPPAWGGPERALETECGTTTALECARQLGTSTEPWATETGYSTAGTFITTNWVSERAQAIYLPRLLLENFRAGIARTYLYELLDLRQSMKPLAGSAVDGFGLWRVRQAGGGYVPAEPKPAAYALANLSATIGDLGAGTAPATTLDIAVRVGGQEVDETSVRRVLLRRADGSYVLALWRPEAVWRNEVARQADVPVAELAADVEIGGTDAWNVTATRPSAAKPATGSWAGVQRIRVPIGADVTLLDLRTSPRVEPGTGGSARDPWALAQNAFWAWIKRWFR